MKKERLYKVVRHVLKTERHVEGHYSVGYFYLPNPTRYIVGQPAVPEVGYLFAFREKHNALRFMYAMDNLSLRIMYGHGIVMEDSGFRRILHSPYTMEKLRAYWVTRTYPAQGYMPYGTVLCSHFTPERVLKRKDGKP